MIRTLKILSAVLIAMAFTMLSVNGYNEDGHSGHEHDMHENHVDENDKHEAHGHEGEGHSDEVTLTPEAIGLFNITLAKTERRNLADLVIVPARISYNLEAMAHIGSQVQGRIQDIPVRLGDEVKKGELLLIVDSPELGAAENELLQKDALVDAARSTVAAATTGVEVAHSAFERARKLREANGISITDYLERQGALRQAEAGVQLAEAEMKVTQSARLAAENQLHIYGVTQEQVARLLETGEVSTRYEVRAPISGHVVEREVTPGEVVGPDREALMMLANMDSLWVLADVPERHVSRVKPGTPARVMIGGLGNLAFEGTVSYIAPQLDFRTRTASVRIVVDAASSPGRVMTQPFTRMQTVFGDEGHHDNHAGHDHDDAHEDAHGDDHAHHDEEELLHDNQTPPGLIAKAGEIMKPGMFSQVEMQLSVLPGQPAHGVVAVPESAVLTVEGGPAVFVPVEGEPNTFAKRSVQLGERVGQYIPVLSGLAERELYVATGAFILKAELGKAGAAHEH